MFAMVEKAGTRLPADASILWGNEMDAYENRIPIHYSKRHPFWVGQRGCEYAQRRDEGKWGQHPGVGPHPQRDYIKQRGFWGGSISSLGASLPSMDIEEVGFLPKSVSLAELTGG